VLSCSDFRSSETCFCVIRNMSTVK
jgi:hypothetical protein